MYDTSLTDQALPTEKYRMLVGTAVVVFISNNNFIIENILRVSDDYNWHDLIDLTSGDLKPIVWETISKNSNNEIASLFSELVYKRNRIVHGYQITRDGRQMVCSKDRDTQIQIYITENFLIDFIHDNNKLSKMLHEFRGS